MKCKIICATHLSELLKIYMENENPAALYWELLTLIISDLFFQIQIWRAFQKLKVIKFL